ncbi:glycosyltransferase [Actimicrobium antarcticum]|uniref:Glycosyltransferase 2-like domain-containing protein n=1 Tax=Actimicrobium antarcticum TaxID=1051899 RepID=A0ABP7T4H6_9BURK
MPDLVSVYLPTKNRLPLLQRAVSSVLGQTARNIELIIISDGSDDGTCDYVRSIASDIQVILIENKTSKGACVARNQAIEKASGKFVTGLDDDDFFMPHRIASFLSHWENLESSNVRFSCLFDTRVVDYGDSVSLSNTSTSVNQQQILTANLIGNQVFARRDSLVAAGMFNPLMPAWQDWDLWARVLKKYGDAVNIQSNTYYFDISHEFERISNRSADKIKKAAQLFYKNNCTKNNSKDILLSMVEYPQIIFTLHDIYQLLKIGKLKLVIKALLSGRFINSLSSSLN